ncbi:MAG: hypothetical protein V1862_01960 [Methanobacteriota archaeon]
MLVTLHDITAEKKALDNIAEREHFIAEVLQKMSHHKKMQKK